MSDIDTLVKGAALFRQGMQDLATHRAVSDANDQVQQIKASQLDETKKRAGMQEVANNFALRLINANAPATSIQAGFNAIAPTKLDSSVDYAREAATTGSPELAAVGNKVFEAEDRAKTLDRKANAASDYAKTRAQRELFGLKDEKKMNAAVLKEAGSFRRENKDLVGLAGKIGSLRKRLDDPNLGKDQSTINSIITAMAKYTNGGGVLTDPDFQREMNDPSLRSKALRRASQSLFGTSISSDREFYSKALDLVEGGVKTQLSNKVNELAEANAPLLGMEHDQMKAVLAKNLGLPPGFVQIRPMGGAPQAGQTPQPGAPPVDKVAAKIAYANALLALNPKDPRALKILEHSQQSAPKKGLFGWW